jgi:prevent-host-death family protein
MKISVDEAQARFSDLLDLIAVGEEVVIMDKGEPVAKLVPILPTEQKPRKLSSAPQKANSPFPMISTIPTQGDRRLFLVTSPG